MNNYGHNVGTIYIIFKRINTNYTDTSITLLFHILEENSICIYYLYAKLWGLEFLQVHYYSVFIFLFTYSHLSFQNM